MIFCSILILSSDTRAELMPLPSLFWPDFSMPSVLLLVLQLELRLAFLEAKAPDTVGTGHGRSLGLDCAGGGGGKTGALGAGSLALELLSFTLWLSPVSPSVKNFPKLWPPCPNRGLKVQRRCSLGLLRMMRRAGVILLDFVLRKYMMVEIITVTKTITVMTLTARPRAFIGLSRLCIRKEAMGPLSRF